MRARLNLGNWLGNVWRIYHLFHLLLLLFYKALFLLNYFTTLDLQDGIAYFNQKMELFFTIVEQ